MAELSRGKRVAPLSAEGGGEFRTLNEGFNRHGGAPAGGHAGTAGADRGRDARADGRRRTRRKQATQAKSRFIAAASHDLRQPLHAIGLFTATLQRRAQGTDLESVVRDLAKAVSVMERLFDSLLDISRLDAERWSRQATAVPARSLFAQLLAEYADAAAEKHLRPARSPDRRRSS